MKEKISAKRRVNIENWKRKEQFHFFKDFDDPFFGLTVNIDCTQAYYTCKQMGYSFFLYYLHKALQVVNSIPEMRYRIEEDIVYEYEVVHGSPTIDRANGTFGYAYFDYCEKFDDFELEAKWEIDKVRKENSLIPSKTGANIIHFTTIPWVNFTSISHPKSFSHPDSIPKISFGKYIKKNRKIMMSVALHVNHALLDGKQVGEFFNKFEEVLNS